ncbi:hypothetical protein V6Z96_003034 [Aspergillus fumigatus]
MSLVIARSAKKETSEPISPTDSDLEKTPISAARVLSCTEKSDLGDISDRRRFFFQRFKDDDPNAIATQPSVFDDPELAEEYRPRPDWENIHRFDPSARWSWAEENQIVRKIDLRITLLACVMLMALELDRSNIQQANADNFLTDLHLTRDGHGKMARRRQMGSLPDDIMVDHRSVPVLALWQDILSVHKGSPRVAIRGFRANGQWFCKHAASFADILAGFLAFGILHLRGVGGHAGWRWLFLIEGLLTLTLGFSAFILMPPSPTQTANWARGKKGWFTERYISSSRGALEYANNGL